MVKNRKYYTFRDVRKAYGDNLTYPFPGNTYNPLTYLNSAYGYNDQQLVVGKPVFSLVTFGTEFKDVLVELILRYDNFGVFWLDWVPGYEEEPSDTITFPILPTAESPFRPKCQRFLESIAYIYNETKDRYNRLLDYYNAQKTHLLDKIESINIMRYNDTPQNGGDWSDDSHTSNITRNESSADVLPLMDKLNSIQNNYRNLIKDWADEFKGLFIYLPED